MNATTNKSNLPASASRSRAMETRVAGYRAAAREAGKIARFDLTEQIQRFTNYTDGKGNYSKCPERAFSNFTRSIYAPLGINKAKAEELLSGRDDFDVHLLNTLSFIESACADVLRRGMDQGLNRSEIKKAFQKLAKEMAELYHLVDDGGFFKKGSRH